MAHVNQNQKTEIKEPTRFVDEVDVYVGQRIKLQRRLTGASQLDMAEALDITFQQIQKYERGINRVSAGRLFKIAKFLDVPVEYFFEGYDADQQGASKTTEAMNTFENSETIKLVKLYYGIQDNGIRKSLLSFMKAICKQDI